MKLKEKFGKIAENYTFIIKTIWKSTPGFLIILFILTLLETFLPLVSMVLSKDILDLLAYPTKDNPQVVKMFVLMSLAVLAMALTQAVSSFKTLVSSLSLSIVSKNVTYMLQKKSYTLDLKFFDVPEYYTKLDNARRVLGRRWDVLLIAPVNLIGKFLSLATMVGIVATFNIWLVPLIVIGVTPNIIIKLKTRKTEVQFFSDQIPENRKISYVENLLSNTGFAKEIRIFGLGEYMLQMSQRLFREQYKKIKKMRLWSFKINTIWSINSLITIFVCQANIGINALWGKITIGQWGFFSSSAYSIQSNLDDIFNILAVSYEEDLYANILMEFLNSESEIDTKKGKDYPFDNNPPLIEFKNVSFSYPGTSSSVLKDVSFVIHPGERIALVGLNGAGKSTVIKLLTRLYDPTEGQILFNGVDIREYKSEDLYKLFSVIFQDFSHFAFSLQDNIGISNIDKIKNLEEIEKAASSSGVDKISAKLSKGYETFITKDFDLDGCSNLSGGEWQKIALARCFFRNAPFVILDEPTAALDPQAEYEVFNQFIELCNNRSALLISHRLSSVSMVDRILFLKNGFIEEAGRHHELMQNDGEYAKLFKLQADRYSISK